MENKVFVMYTIANWSSQDFKWSRNPQIIKVLATHIDTYDDGDSRVNLTYYKYSLEPIGSDKLQEPFKNKLVSYTDIHNGRMGTPYNENHYEATGYPLSNSETSLKELCAKTYQKEMMKLFGLDVNEIKILDKISN